MAMKFKILLVISSLALTLSLMSNTYSRYVADVDSNIDLLFAKWQILVNENDITNNTTTSINITPVMEENVNVAENTVAPSSKGYFDIDIDPSNAGVSFDYSINLNIEDENMPDLMISKYAVLDKDYNEGDQITTTTILNNTINGTVDYNATAHEPFTVRVFFEWYEGVDEKMDDEADTNIGYEAALNNKSLLVNASISFNQKI